MLRLYFISYAQSGIFFQYFGDKVCLINVTS